jgi:hypothetical protein
MIIKSDNKTLRSQNIRQRLRQSGYLLVGLILLALVFFGAKQTLYSTQTLNDESFVLLADAEKIEGTNFCFRRF